MGIAAFRLHRFETVSSTQEEARRLVRGGERPGFVVLAEEQTAGRGRAGAAWDSRKGLGFWMTTVHGSARPACEWPALTSVAALAVCAAVEGLGLAPRIKWPNDCLLGGRKFAGVLAETEGTVVLLGIGVNFQHGPDDFPPELAPRATSVQWERSNSPDRTESEDRERFLRCLLDRLHARLDQFEARGASELIAEVWDRSIVQGTRVIVETPEGEQVAGSAVGLGRVGEILIQTTAGVVPIGNGTLRSWEEP